MSQMERFELGVAPSERPTITFEEWLKLVSQFFSNVTGEGMVQIPKSCWLDVYHSGISPVEAAQSYWEDMQGFFR